MQSNVGGGALVAVCKICPAMFVRKAKTFEMIEMQPQMF